MAAHGEKEAVPEIQTEMTQVLEKEKVREEIVLETELEVQDIVQKEKVRDIVMETTLEVLDIVHDKGNFLDGQDHNEENFHDSQEQMLDDEVFEEVEEVAVHAQEGTQSKRKLSVASDASSNKRTKQILYSNTDFTSLLSMTGATAMAGERVVARSRMWSATSNSFGAWTIHRTKMNSSPHSDSIDFVLRRGGVIKFFPNLVEEVEEVKKEMLSQTTYKQYKVRECGNEPRLHALYCSASRAGGYRYGRVKMASHPLESLSVICGIAEDLASKFGLLDNHWNVGCHLILYRDGKDSIHWHADDTQGEDVVLSLTVDGPVADARTICFQPATTTLKTGDEQLELYPIPGDGYSMDGNVQASYVHAMLKTRPSHVATTGRMAIIFRNGIHKMFDDNGSSVTSLAAPVRTNQYVFGNMCDKLEEGKCYSRDFLFNSQAHRNGHGNIAGNKEIGCASLIVCKLARACDQDKLHFLTYVVGDHSHPKALLRSFVSQQPVRVFRSNKGNRKKSNYLPDPDGKKVLYRYDGVYYVIAAINKEDGTVKSLGDHVADARVFYLIRAEPLSFMRKLMDDNPSLEYFLPALPMFETVDNHVYFSLKGSEDLTGRAWDVNAFHDWNPLTVRI